MLVPQVATSKFVGDALIESFFDCARVCVCAHAYVKYMSKLLAALTGHTDRQSVSYLAAHRAVRSSHRRRRRRSLIVLSQCDGFVVVVVVVVARTSL